jgi:Zn-dependent protease
LFGSFDIGSVFGIRARLHWTFVVLIAVLMFTGWPFANLPLWNAIALGVLFGIVFLHELGHGLVARRFGLQVLDVTLAPFGGFTRMSRIPEDSKIEGWIAFAGPAVNLALGFAALPFAADGALASALHGRPPGGSAWQISMGLFAIVNLSLAVFNLLPAFPLDGGRIARALIALRTDWVSATRRTASIGRWIAMAMICYGLYALIKLQNGTIFLPIFGVFLWFSGVREVWSVRVRHAGAEFARSMGMPEEPSVVASQTPAADEQIAADDPSGARRPTVMRAPRAARREGLSDEEISALERFRGRIGRAEAPE